MAILAAAVILVGLLTALNLFLTFGVIRRLREHTRTLEQVAGGHQGDIMLAAGTAIGAFAATTTTGTTVTDATLNGPTLVGFFSPTCEPCKERLPQFLEYARSFDGRVLAVAVGPDADVADLLTSLRPVADVVVETDDGPVNKAFGVSGYPALCLVDDGVVVASGYQIEALPVPVPAS
ncbi:TlpA disulfide reductase family protein [Longispora sp. NPDC051575]|uniref:TlpA disulfide reductase family protein n=1 Tax=Longispora sp. NPDC051575 TaxID=3154943 RepID=UPI003434A701